MKIKLVTLSFFMVFSAIVSAQKGMSYSGPQDIFIKGKELFLDKNYIGSQQLLSRYVDLAQDRQRIAEAKYLIATATYLNGGENTIDVLHAYLNEYPETYHKNDILYYLGSCHFRGKDWVRALYYFNLSDINYLKNTDQEDYVFQQAYSNLQLKKYTEATNEFSMLERKSSKYGDIATYYKAYIDFREGRYDKALKVFERLKDHPNYEVQAQLYITQSIFLKNDLSGAILAAKKYLQKYPLGKNSSEIYRILGNSYYRLNLIDDAIFYYAKYVAEERDPLREDLYLLGKAYSQKQRYQESIKTLQLAISKDDRLGQLAYMLIGQNYLLVKEDKNALMAFDATSRLEFDLSVSEVALYNYVMLVHKTSLSVFDQSVTAFQRFLEKYPRSKYANEVNKQLASTLLSTTDYQGALHVINKMKSPDKQILAAKQSIFLQLGVQDFIDGNYEGAIKHFNSSINMGNWNIEAKNEAYFWKGETYYRLTDNENAQRNYTYYVSHTNPSTENHLNALYSLGYSYFNMKQFGNALTAFKRYISTENNRVKASYSDALNRIGDCYLHNRGFSNAQQYYTQASTSDNESAEYADLQKAFVLGLQRNFNGKIAALDNMMQKHPNSRYLDNALYEKAKSLVMLSNNTEAISVLSTLIKKYPQSGIAPQAGVLLAQSYYNANQEKEAIKSYKFVAEKYSNTLEAHSAIQSLESIYREMNNVASYAKYVNSLGQGVIITSSKQDSLTFFAAENLLMKGNKKAATKAMKEYLISFPQGGFAGDAYYYIGIDAYEEKKYDLALTEFQKAISSGSSKNLTKALIFLGNIQTDRGNIEEGYKVYKQLNQIAVESEEKAKAQSGVLKTAFLLKKYQEVINTATPIIESPKTSPQLRSAAFLYRAKSHLNTSKEDLAIADLKNVGADSRSVYGAEAQFLLADIYYKKGQYEITIELVEAFMQQNTPHTYWMARAIIVLADSYTMQRDYFQAKLYLESLKANYTGNKSDIQNMIDSRLGKLK